MNTNDNQRISILASPSSPTSIASVMSFQTPSSSDREKSSHSDGVDTFSPRSPLGDHYGTSMHPAPPSSTNMSVVSELQPMSTVQGSSDGHMSATSAMMSFLEEETSKPNTIQADSSLSDQTMIPVPSRQSRSPSSEAVHKAISPVNFPPGRNRTNAHRESSAAVPPQTPKATNQSGIFPIISEFPRDLESDRIYKGDKQGLVMPLRSPSVKEPPIYPAAHEEEPLEAECVDERHSLNQLIAPSEILLSQDDLTAVSTISGTITRKEEVFKLRALLDEVLNAQNNKQDQPPTMPPRRYKSNNMMRAGASPPLSLASDIHSLSSMDSCDCSTLGKTLPRPSRRSNRYNPDPALLPPTREKHDTLLGSISQNLMSSSALPDLSRDNRQFNPAVVQQRPPISSNSEFQRHCSGNAASSPRPVQIEVAPGLTAPVRSSQETIRALERGYAEILSCMVCDKALAVVADCQYVLCPDCRVVFPMTLDTSSGRPPHGVGLALRL